MILTNKNVEDQHRDKGFGVFRSRGWLSTARSWCGGIADALILPRPWSEV